MSTSLEDEVLFDIIIPFPYWESKGRKQIVSLNNIARWKRFGEADIKNGYKELLQDFFIPDAINMYQSLKLEYKVLRHNFRKADAMNVVPIADKWFLDKLVDMGWLNDDDNCSHNISPAEFTESLIETQLSVRVLAPATVDHIYMKATNMKTNKTITRTQQKHFEYMRNKNKLDFHTEKIIETIPNKL